MRWTLLLLLSVLLAGAALAAPATQSEMSNVAANWVQAVQDRFHPWGESAAPEIGQPQWVAKDGVRLGRVFPIRPVGFVIVSADKLMPPVVLYSETSDWRQPGDTECDHLMPILENAYHRASSGARTLADADAPEEEDWAGAWASLAVPVTTEGSRDYVPLYQVGPLMTATWHQSVPYNSACPIGCGGLRCEVGCVASSMARLLKFWSYPNSGAGTHTYYWSGDPGTPNCTPGAPGDTLSAVCSDPYDWRRMPDSFGPDPDTLAIAAVSELCYEAGVTVNMNYRAHYQGSGASPGPNLIDAIEDHFLYSTDATWASIYDLPDYWNVIRSEISLGRPVWITVPGHQLNFDGWGVDVDSRHWVHGNNDGGSFWALQTEVICNWVHYQIHPPSAPIRLEVWADQQGTYPTIQSAIDAAGNGTTILLHDGTYVGPGNRDLNFNGKRIAIRSISDNPDNCTIDCLGSAQAPHRAFLFNHNEPLGTTVQGITITNGYFTDILGARRPQGGAVLCQTAARPLFINCVFERNYADVGGAVGCTATAAPVLERCVFLRNSALEGGAISNQGSGTPILSRSTICNNTAPLASGIRLSASGGCRIAQTIIAFGHRGGAMVLSPQSSALLTCSDLYGNEGGNWTGAISSQRYLDGNMEDDPLFCNLAGDDVNLSIVSPCILSPCGPVGARPARCGERAYFVGVGQQYTTIGQALAAIDDSSRLVLTDTLYTGDGNRDLETWVYALTIQSAPELEGRCVIDVQGSGEDPHSALHVYGGRFTMQGVTVRNACGAPGVWLNADGSATNEVTLRDCSFESCLNRGVMCDPRGRVEIEGCRFENCATAMAGGGLALKWSGGMDSVIVKGCTFTGNVAGTNGGAVEVFGLSGTYPRARVENCLFVQNAAPSGGAISVWTRSGVKSVGNTFVGNAASGGLGSCVYVYGTSSHITMKNDLLAWNGGSRPVACAFTMNVTINCCDFYENGPYELWQGCTAAGPGTNLLLDPLFCDRTGGDYRISPDSPCAPGNNSCGLIGSMPVGCGRDASAVMARDALTALRLAPPVPNPAGSGTTLSYAIPKEREGKGMRLEVYDAAGRLVRTLLRGTAKAGVGSINWDGRDNQGKPATAGVYFCRFAVGDQAETRRVIVMR